jgi:hypothetical protein
MAEGIFAACDFRTIWFLFDAWLPADGIRPAKIPDAPPARRTCVRLRRQAGGETEQIRIFLGHVSNETTEAHL